MSIPINTKNDDGTAKLGHKHVGNELILAGTNKDDVYKAFNNKRVILLECNRVHVVMTWEGDTLARTVHI